MGLFDNLDKKSTDISDNTAEGSFSNLQSTSAPQPQESDNVFKQIGRGVLGGVTRAIPETIGAPFEFFGARLQNEGMKNLGKNISGVLKDYQPEPTDSVVEQGVEGLVTMAPLFVSKMLSMPMNAALSMDVYNKKLEEAKAAGAANPELVAGAHAGMNFATLFALGKMGQSISNPAFKGVFGRFAKETPKELLVPTLGSAIKDIGLHSAIAMSMFAGQAAAGSQIDKQSGVRPDADILADVKGAMGPAAVMMLGGGVLGLGGRAMHMKASERMAEAMRSPEVDRTTRMHIANSVEQFLEKKNPEVAKAWQEYYLDKIRNDQPIDLDISFKDPIALRAEIGIKKHDKTGALENDVKEKPLFKPADKGVLGNLANLDENLAEKQNVAADKKQGGDIPIELGQPAVRPKSFFDVQNLTPKFFKKLPGVKGVSQTDENNLVLTLKNGMNLHVKTVDKINENEVELQAGYGSGTLEKGKVISGSYADRTIKLVRDKSGQWTFHHESVHFAEDMGLMTKEEIMVLSRKIKKLVAAGIRKTTNENDIGGAEDRANYLADVAKGTVKPTGIVSKVINRMRIWADRFMSAIGKAPTAERAERAFTSGEIFKRKQSVAKELGKAQPYIVKDFNTPKTNEQRYNKTPNGGKWEQYDFFKQKEDAYKYHITDFIKKADKELESKYNENDANKLLPSNYEGSDWVGLDLQEIHEESVRNALQNGLIDKKEYQENHSDSYGDWGSEKFVNNFGKNTKDKASVADESELKNAPRKIEGINIFSGSKDVLGRALTNPTHVNPKNAFAVSSKRGGLGQFAKSLDKGIDYNGKHYQDVEEAYFATRKTPGATKENKALIQDIIKQKLLQHPELIKAIDERGGEEFLNKSFHSYKAADTESTIKRVTNGPSWTTDSGDAFMNALRGAYKNIKEQSKETVQKGNIQPLGTIEGRDIVIANVNGKSVPFYKSLHGTDGKVAGKWYPFAGIAENGWFIKGGLKEITDSYGIKELQEIQKTLNESDIQVPKTKVDYKKLNQQVHGQEKLLAHPGLDNSKILSGVFGDKVQSKAATNIVKLPFGSTPPPDVIDTHRYMGKNINNAKPGERGFLGNPPENKATDVAGGTLSREDAVSAYKKIFLEKVNTDQAFRDAVLVIKDKKLGYYKPEEVNHAQVIEDWLKTNPEAKIPTKGVLASVDKNGKIYVKQDVSVDEFKSYITGDSKTESAQQKQAVYNILKKEGIDLIEILKTPEDIKKFLYMHEQSHLTNKDMESYWKNGKSLMTKDKIDIEVRAVKDALRDMKGKEIPADKKIQAPQKMESKYFPGAELYGDAKTANARANQAIKNNEVVDIVHLETYDNLEKLRERGSQVAKLLTKMTGGQTNVKVGRTADGKFTIEVPLYLGKTARSVAKYSPALTKGEGVTRNNVAAEAYIKKNPSNITFKENYYDSLSDKDMDDYIRRHPEDMDADNYRIRGMSAEKLKQQSIMYPNNEKIQAEVKAREVAEKERIKRSLESERTKEDMKDFIELQDLAEEMDSVAEQINILEKEKEDMGDKFSKTKHKELGALSNEYLKMTEQYKKGLYIFSEVRKGKKPLSEFKAVFEEKISPEEKRLNDAIDNLDKVEQKISKAKTLTPELIKEYKEADKEYQAAMGFDKYVSDNEFVEKKLETEEIEVTRKEAEEFQEKPVEIGEVDSRGNINLGDGSSMKSKGKASVVPEEAVSGKKPRAAVAKEVYEINREGERALMAHLESNQKKIGIMRKMRLAESIFETGIDTRDRLKRGVARTLGLFKALKEEYLGTHTYKPIQGHIMTYSGAKTMSSQVSRKLAQDILGMHPDKLRREAMRNYMEAGGDMEYLRAAAEACSTNKNGAQKHEAGYRAAMNLTPEELKTCKLIMETYKNKLADLVDMDMLENGIDNYVNREWEMRDQDTLREALRNLDMSETFYKNVQADPAFLLKRIFKTTLEGELQGMNLKTKDIGHSVVKYLDSFDEAVAARKMIKDIAMQNASDGRRAFIFDRTEPVPGAIDPQTGEFNVDTRTLLNPLGWKDLKALTKKNITDAGFERSTMSKMKAAGYGYIDSPVFKNWKYIGLDENGNKMIYKGNVWIHPEYYKNLKALLERSKVRTYSVNLGGKKYYPGEAALKVTSTLKGTLLSLSGFHQVQVGVHAVFHKINPFKPVTINMADPMQQKMVMHGLSIGDYSGLEMFMEGAASGSGLVSKVPGLGYFMQRYSTYLFQDYIPRLKMSMALEAFDRNTKRYAGKMTEKEILYLTTKQANAAFGELNYDLLGRSKTTQDVMRLMLLAPDFLEARARFVGQALSPYGNKNILRGIYDNEQFQAAVVRGAVGMWFGARIINAILNDGDFKFDNHFSIVTPKGMSLFGADIGEREMALRSIPGDIEHLFKDPRSFVFYRVNPVFVKPTIEAVLGRDEFGRYRDSTQQLYDYFTGFVPIPGQNVAKGKEFKVWESFLKSTGINVYKERTTFEKRLLELKGRRATFSQTREERKRSELVNIFADRLKIAKTASEKQEVYNDINTNIVEGVLYRKDRMKIARYATEDRVLRAIKQMQIEDVMNAWDEASDAERKKYKPMLLKKFYNLQNSNPDRFIEIAPEVKKLIKE